MMPGIPGGSIQMSSMSGPYAGIKYNLGSQPSDFFSSMSSSSSGGSGAAGAGGSVPSIPQIAPPNITPFQYNTDSQSYPTYMRNLGENTAQQAFQRATNRIGAGNSQQNLMHAQDALNQSRLGYMSQAGQQELGVQNSLSDNYNKYLALLAQLYGTQVAQRGQDVSLAGDIYSSNARSQAALNSSGGGVMRLGGGGSTQPGTYHGIEQDLYNDSKINNPVFYHAF
jgi:hypothetical protein